MPATQPENTHRDTPKQFILFTLVAGVVASFAAWSSEALTLEVWVMFAGFIAWFTRPVSWRDGVSAMLCLWLGVGLGAVSYVATGALVPSLGALALPLVVFFVAILIVGLRTTSIVNNMLAWSRSSPLNWGFPSKDSHISSAQPPSAGSLAGLAWR
jgi:Protein of unknown function (DUF1097)